MCVGFWAILSLVAGVVMFYFTYAFSDDKFLNSEGASSANMDISSQKALIVTVLYIFSVFAVALGLIGLFAGCKENRTCTFLTACCVTPTWFLFVLMGIILLMAGSSSQFGMTAICAQAEAELKQGYLCAAGLGADQICNQVEVQEEERKKKLKQLQEDAREETVDSFQIIDRELGPISNLLMCSAKCPCAGVDQQKQWTSLDNEVTIKNYGRDQKKIPFVFNNGSKGVETFRQCIREIAESGDKDTFSRRAKEITSLKGYKQAADFLAFLEKELQCTGFCVPTLFHFAIPTAKGLPAKEACMPQFTATVGDNLFEVGLASLLAGLVMSCLFCWQYCLWKKYD